MRAMKWSMLLVFCLALAAGCDSAGGEKKNSGVTPAPGAPAEQREGGRFKKGSGSQPGGGVDS